MYFPNTFRIISLKLSSFARGNLLELSCEAWIPACSPWNFQLSSHYMFFPAPSRRTCSDATSIKSLYYFTYIYIYICSFFSNHQRCYVAEWWTQYYIYLVIVKEMHCQLGKLKQIRTKLLSTSSIKDPPNKNSHQLFFLGMETSKKHWWYLKHQTCDVCPSKPETASDSSDSSVRTRWEP